MLTYKILDPTDTDDLTSVMQERPEVFNGYTDDEYKSYLSTHIPTMLLNPLFFNIGFYSDNKLFGTMILREFTGSPAWCIAHVLFSRGNNIISREFMQLMHTVDNFMFDEMETKRNLNRFHFAYRATDNSTRSLGSADRFFNLINKVKDTRMSKYVFATDCIIEPNTMPKYEYQKNLILNRTWPIKIGIRTCLKKDEI